MCICERASPLRMHTCKKVRLSERTTRALRCRRQMFIQLISGTNSSDTVAGSLTPPPTVTATGDNSPVPAFIIHLKCMWSSHVGPLRAVGVVLTGGRWEEKVWCSCLLTHCVCAVNVFDCWGFLWFFSLISQLFHKMLKTTCPSVITRAEKGWL